MSYTDQSKLGDMKLGDVLNYIEGKMDGQMSSVQEEIAAVLPEFPETNGTYFLQLVMSSDTATLSWEPVGE